MEQTLSSLPPGWAWTTLGEVCKDPQYGWTTSAVASGRLHLLRTTDITSGQFDWNEVPYCSDGPPDAEKYLLRDGDVVISRAGSVGFSHLVRNPRNAVFASYLIRFKPLINGAYVSYFLKSPSYWRAISEKSMGIALANVNATRLKQIPLPLPPLPEQKRIVAKIEELFSDLDAGVEALKKAKAEIKRYRQSVLKCAFEGKLTSDWRIANSDKTVETAEELLARIREERKKNLNTKARRHEELESPNSLELPKLPEEWVWTRLEDISDATGGFAFKSSEYADSGHQIVKIGNVKMGRLDLRERPTYIGGVDAETIGKYELRSGDILISLTGTRRKRDYGNVAIVGNQKNLLLNQRVARLRFHRSLEPGFFLIALQSDSFRDQFFGGETGNVGQGNVGMDAIRESVVPLPSADEQKQIVTEIERRFSVADEAEKVIDRSLKQAETLRQSILKRAFEGKLVSQDPTDEPAETLLERIRAERARLREAKEACGQAKRAGKAGRARNAGRAS
jgi:type I restriction enzyme S subunit